MVHYSTLFALLGLFLAPVKCDDEYQESLLIKPLEDGKVMAHFEFTTIWKQDIREINFGNTDTDLRMFLNNF